MDVDIVDGEESEIWKGFEFDESETLGRESKILQVCRSENC